jgi:hypothetical protein
VKRAPLHQRIKSQGSNTSTVMAGGHPAVPAPMATPLAQITVLPVSSNYVTLGMEDLAPLTTADGAMVPATSPGRWDQLALAGGGRHG